MAVFLSCCIGSVNVLVTLYRLSCIYVSLVEYAQNLLLTMFPVSCVHAHGISHERQKLICLTEIDNGLFFVRYVHQRSIVLASRSRGYAS